MIATGSVTPDANTAANNTIASRKLAAGPADTIAIRLPTCCRLNACATSSGFTPAAPGSRSSSIFT